MFTILWRYEVEPATRQQFEQEYGPEGSWAKFFRNGDGYVRTELFRDCTHADVYLTIDYWDSEEEFDSFRLSHADKYHALDKKFGKLSRAERRLGTFSD